MRNISYFSIVLSILLCFSVALSSHAAIEAVEFENSELLQRYQALIAELRCTVCQNQNLADSDADLAKDLRRKTEEMLKAGKSDDEVLTYMRDRYGDFVLYRPPMSGSTSVLWIAPFVLLIIAAISVVITVRNKRNTHSRSSDNQSVNSQNDQLQKVRALLNEQSTD